MDFDLTRIKSAVLNQLINTNGLYSLGIQNHIYGCFIIMEDIAQGLVDLSGTVISTPKFSFDLDKQFSDIGIRFGFAMDTKLALDTFNSDYKETWIEYFKTIDLTKNIEESDKIEDALIQIVQENVKTEEIFFIQALDSGSLPQEWIEKMFLLINPPVIDVEIEQNALTHAKSEKPLTNRRHLNSTRRINTNKNITYSKKSLAKTRRHR